ncbi:hypothetical protein [Halopiger goleimassiliensis]|uniref:hypothetical protein n=1 Tax=Halopiger goleimassiliensis TaxID=1293048 RepID=UPI000677C678|nr:hypothetical protein [Halopiger goleimassiliensis]
MDELRRRLLEGISAGGLVLGTLGEAVGARDAGAAAGGQDGPLEVSIVETDGPVPAGEYLRVTTALENRRTSDVRTAVELIVGEDPERIERRVLTVRAGETETVRQGFYTYPVPRDDAFPVRVETDYGTAETTVSVEGASPLPAASPDGELAVGTGTEVFFEAGAVDPGRSQRTVWWVDGDRVAGGVGGPWQHAYFGEADADYFRHEFESPGTHDVAAAVLPEDGGSYAATWTVDVGPDANGPPTVEDRTPADDTLAVGRGDRYEVSLSASDPGGGLDRVVWWLTQADVLLEVQDLAGESDTATLSTDAFCHTCTVLPWVICSDGRIAVADGWQLLEGEDPDDGVSVSIRSTNAPLPAGDTLEVIVDVANEGSSAVTQHLELVVGHDPELVDTQEITLGPGESGAATLEFETYPAATDQTFPARVIGPDDEAETQVSVYT